MDVYGGTETTTSHYQQSCVERSRTFVVSDIHGNNTLFRKALKSVRLRKIDKLIILGDLIDRGIDSKGVLDTVLLLQQTGFNLDIIRGNHEQLFLDAVENNSALVNWLLNGGDRTLSSFSTSSIERIPAIYIKLIKSFKYYLESDNYIFVHAALNMNISNPFSDTNTMLWERTPEKYFRQDWIGRKVLIHGHNPTIRNKIVDSVMKQESIICIDNGSYMDSPNYGSICMFHLELNKIHFFE